MSADYQIFPATATDYRAIIADPRPEDVIEWEKAEPRREFAVMLRDALLRPEARAVRMVIAGSDPIPLAMFGVYPYGNYMGRPAGLGWLILTNLALLHLKGLHRLFQEWRLGLHDDYYVVDCWVDEANDLHWRWLERSGFAHITTMRMWREKIPYRLYRSMRDV